MLYGLHITTIPFYLGIFHTFKFLSLIDRNHLFTMEDYKGLDCQLGDILEYMED